MSEDDGGCMALHSGKYEGLSVSESHLDSVCSVDSTCEIEFNLVLRYISILVLFVGSNGEVRLRFVTPDVYAGAGAGAG